jgi:hypothetical protein
MIRNYINPGRPMGPLEDTRESIRRRRLLAQLDLEFVTLTPEKDIP